MLAPAASVLTVQVIVPPSFGSLTATAVRVTLPVFTTTNVYWMVDPAVFPLGVPACLSTVIAGLAAITVSVLSVADGAGVTPAGGVPVAVAVLAT